MANNWLENHPKERKYFADYMLDLMRGLGYESTFEEAWAIVADDALSDKYYEEAEARLLQYQRGQMLTSMQVILDNIEIKGQKNKFD